MSDAKANEVRGIIVGGSGVGKTCLLSRWTDDSFVERYSSTTEQVSKTFNRSYEGKSLTFQITEVPNTDDLTQYQSLGNSSQIAFLVFDLTDDESIDPVSKWIYFLKEGGGRREDGQPETHVVLVGNKAELPGSRQISEQKAREFADKNKLTYVEVSARTKVNVDVPVEKIFRLYYGLNLDGGKDKKEKGKEGGKQEKKSGRKCIIL